MDERSLARFRRNIIILPTECWFWGPFGTVSDDGYGMFSVDGRSTTAHRASYEHFVGPIPDGLHVDHLCHTWEPWCPGGPGDHHRRCVYWRHLEPVEPDINAFRGVGSRMYCTRRHEFTPESTYTQSSGARGCRTCRDERMREYSHERHPGVLHGTETHCPQNHLYEGDNLIATPDGRRVCRECKRDWSRRNMRAKRAIGRGYIPLLPGCPTCPLGHDLSGDGTGTYRGQIVCMTCTEPVPGQRSLWMVA